MTWVGWEGLKGETRGLTEIALSCEMWNVGWTFIEAGSLRKRWVVWVESLSDESSQWNAYRSWQTQWSVVTFYCGGSGPVQDSFHLLWIRLRRPTRKDVSQKDDRKMTESELNLDISALTYNLFSKSLWRTNSLRNPLENKPDVSDVFRQVLRKEENIVKIHKNESLEKVTGNIIHQGLEDYLVMPKHHHQILKMSHGRIECCLPLIFILYADQKIGVPEVQLSKDGRALGGHQRLSGWVAEDTYSEPLSCSNLINQCRDERSYPFLKQRISQTLIEKTRVIWYQNWVSRLFSIANFSGWERFLHSPILTDEPALLGELDKKCGYDQVDNNRDTPDCSLFRRSAWMIWALPSCMGLSSEVGVVVE